MPAARRRRRGRKAAVVLALWAFSVQAKANSFWCALDDGPRRFVSDIGRNGSDTARSLHQLASRFRRTVNNSYGTAFTEDGGVCQQFPTRAAAEKTLNAWRAAALAQPVQIIRICVF